MHLYRKFQTFQYKYYFINFKILILINNLLVASLLKLLNYFFLISRLLSLNESVLDATPTLTKLRLLFNNYELDTTVNEHVTAMERKEENDFLNAVLATPVMRTAMKFLQEKGTIFFFCI